ncbi:hypothetical protein COCNU_scaffold001515G000020 [Cocos nucifera]|nr:hypothetical protein [Cocos nucifera]
MRRKGRRTTGKEWIGGRGQEGEEGREKEEREGWVADEKGGVGRGHHGGGWLMDGLEEKDEEEGEEVEGATMEEEKWIRKGEG